MNNYDQLNLQYIDGQWRDGNSQKTITSVNSFTDEDYVSFQAASIDDVDQAYNSAKKSQKEWSAVNPYEKRTIIRKAADLLEERKDQMIDILVKDTGSTMNKATMETNLTIEIIRLAETMPFEMETIQNQSMIPGKKNHLIRKPLGVVSVIGPFNFPLYLAMRSVAPALATGNAVVLKASSKTPVAGGSFIAKLFEEAGLPKGVLNYVLPKSSEIGDGFYGHDVPELISFTGSVDIGQRIGEVVGKHVKETILELGGNNPMVVLDDADIDQAVKSAVYGSYYHSGQICMALNRIIVDESIFHQFAEKFVEASKELASGNPNNPETINGPLIATSEADRVEEDVQKAVDEGATVLLEGEREGNVITPYVLQGTNDTYTAKEEMFGPVQTLIPAKSEEEAIKLANDVDEGLTSSVFSTDVKRAYKVANQIEAGMTHINDQSVNDEPYIAFGGEKHSGTGRFGREHSLEEFTTWKWVSIQEEYRDYPSD